MVLNDFLKEYHTKLEDVLNRVDYTEKQIKNMSVIQYSDELLYVLSTEVDQDLSVILYELFHLENPLTIRRVASDYALLKAVENNATYIFIPQGYRQGKSKLLTDLLIELDIFELDLGPIAKYNLFGKKIYESFLKSAGKGEEYKRIEGKVSDYFVLVHDDSGSLLASDMSGSTRK